MNRKTVFVVDDDLPVLEALTEILEAEGFVVQGFGSAEAFLDVCEARTAGCIVLDINLPGMDGLQAQEVLLDRGIRLPIVFLTGHGDVPMSVRAIRAGAVDFLQKPVPAARLVDRVHAALELGECRRAEMDRVDAARTMLAVLTKRERDILDQVVQGKSNKQIAADMDISTRTVEVHRRNIAQKTGVKNTLELEKLVQLAQACTEICSGATPGKCRHLLCEDVRS